MHRNYYGFIQTNFQTRNDALNRLFLSQYSNFGTKIKSLETY